MSARLRVLAQRKQLLLARVQLQRLETTLRAAELRDALRPKSLIGVGIAQPAALIALFDAVAPLFGLRRLARWARLAVVALAAFRIARNWRGTGRAAPEPAPAEPAQ
jgi:hypothetical protein